MIFHHDYHDETFTCGGTSYHENYDDDVDDNYDETPPTWGATNYHNCDHDDDRWEELKYTKYSIPVHTRYLSFLLHRQDVLVNFCSTQKCVKLRQNECCIKTA